MKPAHKFIVLLIIVLNTINLTGCSVLKPFFIPTETATTAVITTPSKTSTPTAAITLSQTPSPTATIAPTITPTIVYKVLKTDRMGKGCDLKNSGGGLGGEILKIYKQLPIDVIAPPVGTKNWAGIYGGQNSKDLCYFVSLPGRNSRDVTFWYGENNTIYWTYGTIGGNIMYYYGNNGMWWWVTYEPPPKATQQTPTP